jgi:hypothetical protein
MNILSEIDLQHRHLQIATAGRWEEALLIAADSVIDLARWFEQADDDVAIESVFCDQVGNLLGFVGFRKKISPHDKRRDFWMNVLHVMASIELQGPAAHLGAWLHLLEVGGLPDNPDGVEIGVFNQWRSAGTITPRSDRWAAYEIQNGPEWLRKGATAPICRESYWMIPERVWVASVVSHEIGGRHFIDPECLQS